MIDTLLKVLTLLFGPNPGDQCHHRYGGYTRCTNRCIGGSSYCANHTLPPPRRA